MSQFPDEIEAKFQRLPNILDKIERQFQWKTLYLRYPVTQGKMAII